MAFSEPRYRKMTPETTLTEVMDDLEIPRDRAVLIVVGWAASMPESERLRINRLLQRVVAPVCQEHGAVVLTGGTDAGVMALAGGAIAEFAPDAVLVGVAPHSMLIGYGAEETNKRAAPPEPHHARLVGAEGEDWGNEASTLLGVADRIATRNRIAMLVIGGGEHTGDEVAEALKRQWPVFLVTETGAAGLSDILQERLAETPPEGQNDDIDEAAPKGERLVAAEASIHNHQLNRSSARSLIEAGGVDDHEWIARALRWRLCDDRLLKEAWNRFAVSDELANTAKKPVNRRVRVAILFGALAVAASVLSVLGGRPVRASSTGSRRAFSFS